MKSALTEQHNFDSLPFIKHAIGDQLHLFDREMWVFGYGSLMWNPGFRYVESQSAVIYGYHRALCIRSIRYRGTPDLPGLVMGLAFGGSCRGVAFRVHQEDRFAVMSYLEDREMVNRVYMPSIKPIKLENGYKENALVFIIQRRHPHYAHRLSPQKAAEVVSSAVGEKGPNIDYVSASLEKLTALGIKDHALAEILELSRSN